MSEKVRVQLGADGKIAAIAAVVDGRLTDQVEMPMPYGEGKEILARRYAEQRGVDLADCWFYSDSLADIPLLEAVGHAVAVNPQRAVRRIAAKKGWPVLIWDTPAGFTTPSTAVDLTFDLT